MDTIAYKLANFFKDKGLSQKEVAEMMGTSSAYINAVLNNRKDIGKKQAEKMENLFGLSSSWLLTGNGEMLRTNNTPFGHIDNEGLPLIPIEAMAGALTGTDVSFMEYDCEKYVVPIFRGAEFLIRVQGDSMIPKYSSGDIVACQRVPLDKLWFQWGKTYVIDTRQGALIKRIEPSDKDGFVSIHSENERYKPFDLPVEEINGVALVCGIIRVE